MPRILLTTWPFVALLMVQGCATTNGTGSSPADESLSALADEVKARCAEMEQAMRDDDLVRVASFYADDGVLLGPSGNRRGGSRTAIEEYWAGFGQGIDWSLVTRSVEGKDNLAVQRGTSILTYISPRDGEQHTSTVEFILLWQRQEDGTLRIAMDGYW